MLRTSPSHQLLFLVLVGATALMLVLLISIWRDGAEVTQASGEVECLSPQTTSDSLPRTSSQGGTAFRRTERLQDERFERSSRTSTVLTPAPNFEPAETEVRGE